MENYFRVREKIANNEFLPLYLFFGEERYLQEELIGCFVSDFLGPEGSFGKEWIEGSCCSLEEVLEKASESNIFSQKRLLVVDDPPYIRPPRGKDKKKPVSGAEAGGGKTAVEQEPKEERHDIILQSYLENRKSEPPESIVVFLAPQVDRRKRFYKFFAKADAAIECSPLKGKVLSDWIKAKASGFGKRIDYAALEKLLYAGDGNLHYYTTELAKYATYLNDDQDTITAEIVERLFSGDLQGSVFRLADALTEGNLEKAVSLLHLLLRKREKPLQILFMLARHYRLVLHAKGLEADHIAHGEYAKLLGVPSFAVSKLKRQAAFYGQRTIVDVLLTFQDIDKKIKTGVLDPVSALELILSRINHIQKSA